MKIVLVGYMGSGKSTVGKLLAEKLNSNFIDLDDYLEAAEQKAISQIFEEKGEIYFRKKEYFYLKEILDSKDSFVLSTGGGTPCYGENMDAIITATPNVFYLNVSITGLVDRLASEKEERPLIADIPDEELPEFIGKHLFERSFYYSQAKHTIFNKDRDATLLVEDIVDQLV